LTREGQERIILWSNSVIKDERGQLASVLSIGIDATPWKETERDLRQKMTQLERFVKVTMDREKVVLELKREVKRLEDALQGRQGGHEDL
jgi:biotin-(acetyl-CoA carboxylase) ligase